MMLGLLFAVTGFTVLGWSHGVAYPDYVWNVPLGTFIFIVAIAFDTIGHRTAYREELEKGESLGTRDYHRRPGIPRASGCFAWGITGRISFVFRRYAWSRFRFFTALSTKPCTGGAISLATPTAWRCGAIFSSSWATPSWW